MEEESNELVAGEEQPDDTKVEDEAERSDVVVPRVTYQISSYGADYDVDGIIKRLEKRDIYIPDFQRSYVWSYRQACEFIESLLLGLPVPGIFFARQKDTNRLQILDGQQRLKTLQFFRKGIFDPGGSIKSRVFILKDVNDTFEGKEYSSLEDRDRRRFDDSTIHATIVKQDSPKDDDTSIYHIFKRLNSSSSVLRPQEIRHAVYHGPFIDEIRTLNDNEAWRKIYGKKNRRLKDEELILRFLALLHDADEYERPMVEFLNKFAARNQEANSAFIEECSRSFGFTINMALEAIGERVFRRERVLNAAVFDSVMVGLARRLSDSALQRSALVFSKVQDAYDALLNDTEFIVSTTTSTADERAVELRLRKATEFFQNA